MIVRFIYTIFIGILLAIFVGVGIAAFYPEPKAPEYPIELTKPESVPEECLSPEDIEKHQAYEQEEREFGKQMQTYNKNVSIIAVVASIIILTLSLTLFKKILLIADGLLLGGVLTLIYSIIRGFGSQDEMFRFIVVAISLVVALLLGYIKFIKPSNKNK